MGFAQQRALLPAKPARGSNEAPRRRAQRRRKNDCCVTSAECARAPIPDAPRSPPSQGTRFKAGGVSRFLLPTSLCGRQREVGAAPHRGNANRPLTNQAKANKNNTKTPTAEQAKPPKPSNHNSLPPHQRLPH